jgi:hypothetical protein
MTLAAMIAPNNTHLSVRHAMVRFGLLAPPASLREFLQHVTVDYLEVAIKTKDEPHAGTDDEAFLRVNAGRERHLNQSLFDGDFVDEYEAVRTGGLYHRSRRSLPGPAPAALGNPRGESR